MRVAFLAILVAVTVGPRARGGGLPCAVSAAAILVPGSVTAGTAVGGWPAVLLAGFYQAEAAIAGCHGLFNGTYLLRLDGLPT